VSVIAVAQEDTVTAQDYLARYEGIPFERLEDGGFVLGDPAAPITIVEFADFLCSHC
jgi:protein-disulfide isomerase